MNLLKATGTIGGLTLVSRFAGLARDMLMATYLGAGMASDAFQIALRLPNLFRALFAEGALAAVFVPMFNRTMAEGDKEEEGTGRAKAIDFAGQVLSGLLPFLLIFTGLMIAATGQIVWAMTGGFPDGEPGKLALAVEWTRITFPYLALISVVSLLGGILNSFNRFWVNAAAPILLNICMIVAMLFFRGDNQVETGRTLAIAVTISGILQLAWLWWSCRAADIKLRLRWPRLTPKVKQMLWLMGPAAVGQGAIQFNLFVSTTLAARYLPEGSISYLYYADRLNQLPLGLIGIGVGTAILPTLSRQIGSGNEDVARHTQNRAMELALFLALPAAVALIIAAVPLVRGVFEHGQFLAADTIGTAAVLSAFSFGVPAYVLIKVLTPGFYARQDTKTPVRLAIASMLVNLGLNLFFILYLNQGVVSIAISTAIAAWVNVVLLYAVLHRRGQFRFDARFVNKAWRIALAALVMGAALWFANPYVAPFMTGGLIHRILVLSVFVGTGMVVYTLASFLFRAYTISELKASLRRQPAPTPQSSTES